MTDITKMIAERKSNYGEFSENAKISQHIKHVMRCSNNWSSMHPIAREAMEMIAHKCSRILSGDPDYLDSWEDIIGYTKRVIEYVEKGETLKL